MTFTATKSYYNYPCAHRQWKHDGHCKFVHGYSRSFHFTFGSLTLTKEGFVVDYGDLKWLKHILDDLFDHTLLLNTDDPLLEDFKVLEKKGACLLRCLPYGVGMEGTAKYLCELADTRLRQQTEGRAWVISVEARENDKNSSTYTNPFVRTV